MKFLTYFAFSLIMVMGTHGRAMSPGNDLGKQLDTRLIQAAQRGNRDLVELMLDAGANINATDRYGNSALMYAAGYGFEHIVRFLVKRSANPNMVNEAYGTPIMWAAEKGYTRIVRFLLPHATPENLNQRDILNASASDLASSEEIATLLYRAGAAGFYRPSRFLS